MLPCWTKEALEDKHSTWVTTSTKDPEKRSSSTKTCLCQPKQSFKQRPSFWTSKLSSGNTQNFSISKTQQNFSVSSYKLPIPRVFCTILPNFSTRLTSLNPRSWKWLHRICCLWHWPRRQEIWELMFASDLRKDSVCRWDSEVLTLDFSRLGRRMWEKCLEGSSEGLSMLITNLPTEWHCRPDSNIFEERRQHPISVLLKPSWPTLQQCTPSITAPKDWRPLPTECISQLTSQQEYSNTMDSHCLPTQKQLSSTLLPLSTAMLRS